MLEYIDVDKWIALKCWKTPTILSGDLLQVIVFGLVEYDTSRGLSGIVDILKSHLVKICSIAKIRNKRTKSALRTWHR